MPANSDVAPSPAVCATAIFVSDHVSTTCLLAQFPVKSVQDTEMFTVDDPAEAAEARQC